MHPCPAPAAGLQAVCVAHAVHAVQYEEDLAAGRAPDHVYLSDPSQLHFTLPGASARTPAAAPAPAPVRASRRSAVAAVEGFGAMAGMAGTPALAVAAAPSGYQVRFGSGRGAYWQEGGVGGCLMQVDLDDKLLPGSLRVRCDESGRLSYDYRSRSPSNHPTLSLPLPLESSAGDGLKGLGQRSQGHPWGSGHARVSNSCSSGGPGGERLLLLPPPPLPLLHALLPVTWLLFLARL